MKYKIGFYQAVGVVTYCFLVGVFFANAEKIFGQPETPMLIIPVMLSIFTFSVATVGTLIFGYPAYLFFQKRFREAFTIIITTIVSGLLIIALILSIFKIISLF